VLFPVFWRYRDFQVSVPYCLPLDSTTVHDRANTPPPFSTRVRRSDAFRCLYTPETLNVEILALFGHILCDVIHDLLDSFNVLNVHHVSHTHLARIPSKPRPDTPIPNSPRCLCRTKKLNPVPSHPFLDAVGQTLNHQMRVKGAFLMRFVDTNIVNSPPHAPDTFE